MKFNYWRFPRGLSVLSLAALTFAAGCTIHLGSDGNGAAAQSFRASDQATLEIELPDWDIPVTDASSLPGNWKTRGKWIDQLDEPASVERRVQLRFRSQLQDGRSFDYTTSGLRADQFRVVQRPEGRSGEVILEAHLSTARLLLREERDGAHAEGDLEIIPDAAFLAQGGELLEGELTVGQLLRFGLRPEPLEYIKLVCTNGNEWTWSEVLHLQQRGVDPAFIRGLRQPQEPIPERTPDHPADPSSRELFDANDIVLLHSRGVGVEYVEQLDAAGTAFKAGDIVLLHSRGVRPEYVREVLGSGVNATAGDLVLMHNRGVTSEFAGVVQKAGYQFTPHDLVLLHSRGVRTDYLLALKRAGYDYSSHDVVLLYGGGVQASFLSEIADEKYEPLSASEVLRLHRGGVPSEMVKRLRK